MAMEAEPHLPYGTQSWPPSQQHAGQKLQPELHATSWQTLLRRCRQPKGDWGTERIGNNNR